MIEQWKEIVKPDGASYKSTYISNYFVSDLGRVKSVHASGFTMILKPTVGKNGYPLVRLRDGNKTLSRYVHQLVLWAFVGSRQDGMEIDHIDRVRSNNRLENLRYVTPKENQDNTILSHSDAHAKERKPVLCVETKEVFKSVMDASRGMGIHSARISESCKKGWATKGFHFQYIPKENDEGFMQGQLDRVRGK